MCAMRLHIVDWGSFKIHILQEILKIRKSTSGGALWVFGSPTFVPISWMCKKQTSVSHSSTGSEIISLDAGLRMDGLPALDLWDLVIEVLRTTHGIPNPTQASTRETRCQNPKHTQGSQCGPTKRRSSSFENAHLPEKESQLYIFEDDETVMKMIIKGRSPTMRHVSRTNRVALDWLFDRITQRFK